MLGSFGPLALEIMTLILRQEDVVSGKIACCQLFHYWADKSTKLNSTTNHHYHHQHHNQLLPNSSPLYIASALYWPFLVNISVKFLVELVKSSKWPPLSFELFMELNWTENTCWSDIKCQNQPDKKGGEERRQEPLGRALVKRKIMSLTSHYPDEAQHIWRDSRLQTE